MEVMWTCRRPEAAACHAVRVGSITPPASAHRMSKTESSPRVAVIGGGPAGLMAAEMLAQAGLSVTIYDRMPTFGRKLLMAGRGGLNLTHSEDLGRFVERFGEAIPWLRPLIEAFPPDALRRWSEGLGQQTFVG